MAIYHYQEKTISRSQGRSACSGVSYITKKPLHDERTGQTHAYSARGHEVTVHIYTPKDAPSWTQNLQTFWNKVEAFEDLMAETRFKGHPTCPEKDARSLAAREEYKERAVTSHTSIFALPREFTRAQSQDAIKRFVDRYFIPRRLCVTAGFHWEKHNPHVHLQIAPRGLEGDSFSALKNRDLNSPQELRVRRHLIADVVNEVAKENGLTVQVDARSFKDRDIDLIPTRHEGWFAQKYLQDASRIIQENQEIKQENIKILFEKPENLLKIVMGNNSVVTRDQIEAELFQRVGGDAELWAMLSHRLTSWTRENARQNSPLFQTLSRTPSLSPYLSSYRSEENAEIRGSEKAERLHASLPAGLRETVSLDALQAALSQESHGSPLQDAFDLSELSGANMNVSDVKAGAALPSEEKRLQLVHRFVDALAEQGLLDQAGDSFGREVYTTQKIRELEKRTQGALQTLSQSSAFGISQEDRDAARLWVEAGSPHSLDPEQWEAVTVLTGSSALVSLEGPAGTGKTTVLKTVRQAYESQGYRVRGTSFQGKTAAFLGEDVGIESETLDLFQRRWKKLDEKKEELAAFKALPASKRFIETVKASRQQEVSPSGKRYKPETTREKLERQLNALAPHDLTSKDVLFVDEAYLSPSSSLRPLLERASEKGAKVILVGDGYQGLIFASGDLARQAKKYGPTISLQTIRRQQSSWQRAASEKLSRHDLWGGFSMYQERGQLITGASSQETEAALVRDWMAAVRDETGAISSQKIQDSLILARTNEVVDRLDQQVVQALKREGDLGQGFLLSQQSGALEAGLKDAEKAFKATLSPYDKVTRQTLQSAWERGTLTQDLLSKTLTEAQPSFFSLERAISQKNHRAVHEAFRSLQGVSAVLFAEHAENTFYEGQRVSFRSNDYSNAFKVIPPWELKDTSSHLSKALLSLHQRMEKIDTGLSFLDAPEQRRVRGALLDGDAGPAQKALVKAGQSPGIFGVFHDLQKIVKTPKEVRETYHVFRKTPKGVRNGQEGTFLGEGNAPGSFRVHLEKGSVIEFVPQDLNPRSFADKILRPAYAMTYDRSQGLTRDQVFALLEACPANKLYVAGSRHRISFKGYFNGQQTQDVKQMLIRSEKSDYRPTLEDYVVNEAERPYQRRVSGYVETLQKHQQILVQIMELKENTDQSAVLSSSSYRALSDAQRTLFDSTVLEGPARQKFEESLWEDIKDLKNQQQESALEISEDLEGHRLFLNQAGISIKSLLVAAGIEERSLSSLEKLAFHKVAAYSAVVTKTRDLWEEIAETHSGALCYGHPAYERYAALKKTRDQHASALLTGQALVGEKLIGHQDALSVINEPVTLLGRVLKDPALPVTIGQMKAHHQAHLSRLAEQETFKGFEAAHQKVVTYRQTRNLAAASFKEHQKVDPALLDQRDQLAFEIVETLGQDPGMTKVVKNLLATERDGDKLLQHAIRGEVRSVLKTYHQTQDLTERGKIAHWLGSQEAGRGVLRAARVRPEALLFESQAIRAFLATERSPRAQQAFQEKLLAWRQEDQNRQACLAQRQDSLKQAVGAYQPVWHALHPPRESRPGASWRSEGRQDRFFEGPGATPFYAPSQEELDQAASRLSERARAPLARSLLKGHLDEAQDALAQSEKISQHLPLLQEKFDRASQTLLASLPPSPSPALDTMTEKAAQQAEVRALFDTTRSFEERQKAYQHMRDTKVPVERICRTLAFQEDGKNGVVYDSLALLPLVFPDQRRELDTAWQTYSALTQESQDLRHTILKEQRSRYPDLFDQFEGARLAAQENLSTWWGSPSLAATLLKKAGASFSDKEGLALLQKEASLSQESLGDGLDLLKKARAATTIGRSFEGTALSVSPRSQERTALDLKKDKAALALTQDPDVRSFLETQETFSAKTLLKDAYRHAVRETLSLESAGGSDASAAAAKTHLEVLADVEKDRKNRILSRLRLDTYDKTGTWPTGEARALYETASWQKGSLLTAFYDTQKDLINGTLTYKKEARLLPDKVREIKAQLAWSTPFEERFKAYHDLRQDGWTREEIAKGLGCHGEYLSLYEVGGNSQDGAPQTVRISKETETAYRSYVEARLSYSDAWRFLTFQTEKKEALTVFLSKTQETAARHDVEAWTQDHLQTPPSSQKALVHDLLGALAGNPQEASPLSREERLQPVFKRHSVTLKEHADLSPLITSLGALEKAKKVPYGLVREALKQDPALQETLTALKEKRAFWAAKVVQNDALKNFFEKQGTFESRRLLASAVQGKTALFPSQESSFEAPALSSPTERETQNSQSGISQKRSTPFRSSVDLKALNDGICESVDLERLGRDLGLIEGKGRSERQGQIRYGTKGAFSINLHKNVWHDFETGAGGNAFSMLKEAGHRGSYQDQIRTLSDYTDGSVSREIDALLEGQEVSQKAQKGLEARRDKRDAREAARQKEAETLGTKKQEAIRALVEKSVSLEGTQAETYLREERGLTGPFPKSLRYVTPGTSFAYPDSKGGVSEKKIPFGAMLSLATDKEGTLKAVQLTYLNGKGGRGHTQEGAKLPKLTFGAPKGAFVDLSVFDKSAAQKDTVFLAEGVETALSVKQAGAQRVVASLGLTNLKNFETTAKKVILCADWDGSPDLPKALYTAQTHFQEKGQKGNILLPVTSGTQKKDFNDLLLEGGLKKVQDRLRSVLNISLDQDKASELLLNETKKDDQHREKIEKAHYVPQNVVEQTTSEERRAPETKGVLSPTSQKPHSLDSTARAFKETPPSVDINAHRKDDPPPAFKAYLQAEKTLQELQNTRPQSYACAKAMTAFETAEKALVACEKSRQAMETSDPQTYHRLVQEHGDVALKTQVFDTAFAAAQQGYAPEPTDLMRSLETARHQESLTLKEGRPYVINNAQVALEKAEKAASRCPHTMAHLSHKEPQTFEKLTQQRQQDLQREQQKERGVGLER